MINRLVIAIVIGIVVTLVCIFVGGILTTATGISWVVSTGQFLSNFAGLFGLLAALWSFFGGGSGWSWPNHPRVP